MIFAVGLIVAFISAMVAWGTVPTLVDYINQSARLHLSTFARLGVLLGMAMMVGSLAMLAIRYLP